ncbi:hypothetical protein FMM80_21880 [Schaedlerella arabinosiphila]|uniref:Uncharacterized protein n=1 Tax=Schaedlerella arabinosiphila TaxID=2044587 RepID=A0A9X5H983_9FIRM|nr:hypothetical protein [Schaedlerella arabinosiphila]KAI4438988.1 hypothetical protein C824_001474 [Schaedlerella arabinosiphila]NDO71156.1 hypothetical protein [Schaedlerella arabinosiphila]
MYRYGEEISYKFELLKTGDYNNLQFFECGNERLDNHIKSNVIKTNEIVDEDGLYFKFTDLITQKIIGIVSLASSGIIYKVSNYTHVLPAIKIDVLAVDKDYQKLHYDFASENDPNPDNHYYFSDDIIGTTIKHCRDISENYTLVNYIVLYADKKAYRYYERNGFENYTEYMVKENNQEINKNIPMYLKL